MRLIKLLLLFISVGVFANTHSIRLFDTGEPIHIKIPVSREVMITFDNEIQQIGFKQDISNKIQSESIDARWWLKAKSLLESQKILVKDKNGKIIVFLISSFIANKDTAINKNYHVVSKKHSINKIKKTPQQNKKLSLVDITRFAAQQLYAPKRLIKDIGLNEIPVSTTPVNIFSCHRSTICVDTIATPIFSYESSDKYISAIKVVNNSNKIFYLDHRDIIGNFIAATFQFEKIDIKNSPADTTVLYVISNQPLEQSL
jgi:integrating conjugative element protein (TIGR03749 family)